MVAHARTASIVVAGVASRPRSRSSRLNDVMRATGPGTSAEGCKLPDRMNRMNRMKQRREQALS